MIINIHLRTACGCERVTTEDHPTVPREYRLYISKMYSHPSAYDPCGTDSVFRAEIRRFECRDVKVVYVPGSSRVSLTDAWYKEI